MAENPIELLNLALAAMRVAERAIEGDPRISAVSYAWSVLNGNRLSLEASLAELTAKGRLRRLRCTTHL